MANILTIFSCILLLNLLFISTSNAGRCTRLENAKRSSRVSGDGGYRIFIDGDPKVYQPGKIYNGEMISYLKIHTICFVLSILLMIID